MRRLLITLLLLLGSSTVALANDSARGYCEEPNRPVVTSGLNSTTRVQASHPSCVVTVYVHGGALATIYADNNLTPLANPFTAQSNGQWQFYAANGRYDVTLASAGYSQTITYSDILLCDPFAVGSTCNNGGSVQAHDLLSTTHLDTIPASPPTRGDIITAQNQTSPTNVNPSWARLALGNSGYVLTSDGTDAVWAPAAGGGGCSPPGTDTGVISEHPVGTCYDSANYTWDDGTGAQNLQAGLTNAVGTALTFAFGSGHTLTGASQAMTMGTSNTLNCQQCNAFGDSNSITPVGVTASGFTQVYVQGQSNTIQGNSVASDYHVIGFNNQIKMGTNASNSILSVFALTEALTLNTAFSNSNAATINVVNALGKNNNATLLNDGASLFSWTVAGDNNTVEYCTGGCSALFQFGETNDSNAYFVNRVGMYGYNNKLIGNTDQGHFQFADLVGTSNQFISTGNTGVQNALIAGFGGHLTNCSSCFLFGANGNVSGTSNFVGVGMSATPELVITAGQIKTNSPIIMDPSYLQQINTTVSALNTCNSGLKGAMDAVSDSSVTTVGSTVAAGGSSSVQVYCNGTNWLVSGGGSGSGGGGSVTTTGSPASGNLTKFSGASSITNGDLTGDVTTSGTLATTLANSGVSAGSCGDTTHSCSLTIDAKGRITAQSNNVISGGGGGNVSVATVTLDSTTLPAAMTSPATIIAAPGSGNVIVVHNCFAQYKFGSAAFIITNAASIVIGYSGNVGTNKITCFFNSTGFIDQGSSQIEYSALSSADVVRTSANVPPQLAQTSAANTSLVLTRNSSGSAMTLSLGTGSTLTITVYYSIIALT